jgi:hypothetical protein
MFSHDSDVAREEEVKPRSEVCEIAYNGYNDRKRLTS